MFADNFDLSAYCQRIGFTAELRADLATVQGLMQQQLRTVAFENLDVLAGKVISLQPEAIVEKIIARGRGGYCYEVNGLFAMALSALGIAYQWVAARPMFYPMKRPRTHAALIVSVDGAEYLCDLGFGSYGIRAPLRVDVLDTPTAQDHDTYQLTQDGHDLVLQALVDGEWANQYGFTRCPVEWVDFAPANWLNSTNPDAVFTQKPLIVLFTPTGRKVLFGDNFKQIDHDQVTQYSITPAQQADCLATHFHLQRPTAD